MGSKFIAAKTQKHQDVKVHIIRTDMFSASDIININDLKQILKTFLDGDEWRMAWLLLITRQSTYNLETFSVDDVKTNVLFPQGDVISRTFLIIVLENSLRLRREDMNKRRINIHWWQWFPYRRQKWERTFEKYSKRHI